MEITLKLRGITKTRCETCGECPALLLTDEGLVCSENCYTERRVRSAVWRMKHYIDQGRAFAPAVQRQVEELLEEMKKLKCIRPYEMCLECGEHLHQSQSQKAAPEEGYVSVWRCPVIGCPGTEREIHRLGHPNEGEEDASTNNHT